MPKHITFSDNYTILKDIWDKLDDVDVGNDWHPEIDIVAAMAWGRELNTTDVGRLLDDPFVAFRGSAPASTFPGYYGSAGWF